MHNGGTIAWWNEQTLFLLCSLVPERLVLSLPTESRPFVFTRGRKQSIWMAGSLARGLPLLVFVIEHNKQRINTARWEIRQRSIQTISFLRQVEVFLISEYLTTAQTVKQQANIKANTSVIVLQPLLTCQTETDIAITLMFLFCLGNVMKNTTKQWKLWIMWQNCCRQTRTWGGWVSRGGCQPPPARGMALARPP